MKINIYQINQDRDTQRLKFMGLDAVRKVLRSAEPDCTAYDKIYSGDVKCRNLEDVFVLFQSGKPEGFQGHSLSVSDVVEVEDATSITPGFYFCDSIGFKEIPFDESKAQKPENLMRVVYVEPGEKPYTAEILHTLQAEQKAVGGLIEPIYNEDDTILVGNEESKLMGMQGNRRIGDGSSIIAGPFFVCGDTGEDFRSLTDAEVEKYMDRFAEPEDITDEEVQRDTGFAFFFGM